MKQLIGLIRLGALTAFSVALYSAHRQTQATQKSDNHHCKKSDRQGEPEGELVLVAIDTRSKSHIARKRTRAVMDPTSEGPSLAATSFDILLHGKRR